MNIVSFQHERRSLKLAGPIPIQRGEAITVSERTLVTVTASEGTGSSIDIAAHAHQDIENLRHEFSQFSRQPALLQAIPNILLASSCFYIDILKSNVRASADGIPLRRYWNLGARPALEVNYTIGHVTPPEAARAASSAKEEGYRTLKLKLGRPDPLQDAAVVDAVRRAHPEAVLRGDANGAWDFNTAVDILNTLEPFGWEYIEQPVKGVEALGELRKRSLVPLAIDEGLREENGYERARLTGVPYWILKPTIMGGLPAIRRAFQMASDVGVTPVVTSTFDGPLTLAALGHLAAAFGPPGVVTGLDDSHLAPEERLRTTRGSLVYPDEVSLFALPQTYPDGSPVF